MATKKIKSALISVFYKDNLADKTQPFGYQHSDLKNLYTSAQSLQSRLSAPIMTQSQMLNLPNWN